MMAGVTSGRESAACVAKPRLLLLLLLLLQLLQQQLLLQLYLLQRV